MLGHFFITFTCIPSGPLDLFHFIKLRCFFTSSSVIVKSLSNVSGVGPGMGISLSMGSVFVMTLVKKSFNRSHYLLWVCNFVSCFVFYKINSGLRFCEHSCVIVKALGIIFKRVYQSFFVSAFCFIHILLVFVHIVSVLVFVSI